MTTLWDDLANESQKPGSTMTITKAQYSALLEEMGKLRSENLLLQGSTFHHALDAVEQLRDDFALWLASELSFPFDVYFETPPPVTIDDMAKAYNRLDPSASVEDWKYSIEMEWPK